MRVDELFTVHSSRSRSFSAHKSGEVAFVTNGLKNNGIVGYVEPLEHDRVFKFWGICVSAFCEATAQKPSFVTRGNGGSGLTVLEPLQTMTYENLLYYAAYLNKCVSWRFSFGRMVTKDRISRIEIPTLGNAQAITKSRPLPEIVQSLAKEVFEDYLKASS
jgi:hypothetical protein